MSMLNCIDQTIYCLLIQPNPDSALNATAGHLLQEDYHAFARQARLMTSIHASAGAEDAEQIPTMKGKSASSMSSVVVRKLPERTTSTQSAPSNHHQAPEGERPASGDEGDESASKENDPLLSKTNIRRPTLAKRPLSNLPIVEPEYDLSDATFLSSSEQNVVNNLNSLAGIGTPDSSWKGLQLAERSQSLNVTGRGLQERGGNGMGSVDFEGRPTKRICSDSGKENAPENWGAGKLLEKPLPAVSVATKVGAPTSRKVSVSSSSGTSSVKGKSRVGLRRL